MPEAIESRDTIGQVKGILMERYGVFSDEAFGLLVSSGNDRNTKLSVVAPTLVTSGQLPGNTCQQHVPLAAMDNRSKQGPCAREPCRSVQQQQQQSTPRVVIVMGTRRGCADQRTAE